MGEGNAAYLDGTGPFCVQLPFGGRGTEISAQGYRIWGLNALLGGELSDARHICVAFMHLVLAVPASSRASPLLHGSRDTCRSGLARDKGRRTFIRNQQKHKGHPKVAFAAGAKKSAEAYFFTSQPVSSARALPMSASERTVFTPASCSAANFSSAVPLPPEMIAPAWPMRLPGGAVTPAM